MTITPYSILFSFLWGSIFVIFLVPIRQYLLRHCAYNILLICSLFAIFRSVFIFDLYIPLYSDFLYQVGKMVTIVVKKTLNNTVLQLSFVYDWNSLKLMYNLFKVFAFIWILGSIFLIYKNLVHIRRIMNLHRDIPQTNNAALFMILKCVQADMNVSLDVRIIESEYIQVPFLFGFFQPTIYLGTCFLNDNEVYAVLYHELTHFVRHDNWLKFILHCIYILFWWNPMIRILSNNIYDACEYRCDQLVTRNMNKMQKIDYASIINRMTSKSTPSTDIGISLVSTQHSDYVYDRLHTFLFPHKMKSSARFIIISIAGAIITISLISILFISQTNNVLTPTETVLSLYQ